VNLQRETGGNLAEILENLARLIRERYKLQGHVRVLASQAKISAQILFAVPFITALIIWLLNPNFFNALLDNTQGKALLAGGVCWMVIGMLVMRKMVAIKV
ncbi:MAG: type II secretion system F family protein, partial [Thermodesulfobacteriota bacterium]